MGYIPLPPNVVAAVQEGGRRASSERCPSLPIDDRRSDRVSRPPSAWDYFADRAFRALAQAGVWLILILLGLILWAIGGKASVGIRDYGFGFLTSTTWDVGRQQFGILPHIWGTLYSSLLALAIGGFFGVVMAIFLTQDFLPPRLAQVFRTIVELLAAIPSVVYGLWGSSSSSRRCGRSPTGFYERLGLDPVLRHAR